VIVCGVSEVTPYGLLRKVTNISANGSQMIVETVNATLEDAIQECDISGTWSLSPDGSAVPLGILASESTRASVISSDTNAQPDSTGGMNSAALADSCTGWYIDINDQVLFDLDKDMGTTNDQIVADGSLCADVQLDFGFKIRDWKLQKARFLLTTVETAQLEIMLRAGFASVSEKREVYRKWLTPFTIWVGIVPIVVVPVLSFNVGVDATASVGISTSITFTNAVTVGVRYSGGAWSPVTDRSTSFEWGSPSLTAGCEVKGYVGPQLTLLLAGITGPYGEVRGYLEVEADLFETPWWKLYGGIEADVGFRAEILGHLIADYEVPAAIGYRVLLAQAETGTRVNFPDPNLEAAVREAIGKPTGDIYASDLAGLTSLDASERNIADLTGLEYAAGLTWLALSENQVVDISPLADLTKLTYLYLENNQISDISPLASLSGVIALGLSNNQISDISPLASLTNLEVLWAHTGQITDISPLANLTNLTRLYLCSNQITDISPLANLTNLTVLQLCSNQISDISPLANLTNLPCLDVSSNQISDISPLASLTSLTFLSLKNNQINDISPLVNLTNLTDLDLTVNQISDISALANLTNLTYLWLGVNQISNVSPLANLTDLTYLWLGNNQISDISPLANLTDLPCLDLAVNQISDISALANLTNLRELFLGHNQISDISPLIDNLGLGEADKVFLYNNPLSEESRTIYIPELEDRGVTVYF